MLGTHTDAEWNATLRHRPAPYAVLVSDAMMLSVPVRHINDSNLTEPTRLMTWWNEVVEGQDDLTGQVRTSPELANIDRQISAGAAHSGYPYQAYERHWGNMTDVERLTTSGSWGDFHELGHNHQRGWWTFDGDVEVSVNIMSNFSLETAVSAPSPSGWGYSVAPSAVYERAKADIAPGGTYSSKPYRWSFWFQLADGFGWDAYRAVFRSYEYDKLNAPDRLPKTDADEKSQWLVRFSTEVGRDLSPRIPEPGAASDLVPAGDLGEEGVVAAGGLTAALDDVPRRDRSGELVEVAAAPTVVPGRRPAHDGRVRGAAGDDDVGASRECIDDAPTAQVGIGGQHAGRIE